MSEEYESIMRGLKDALGTIQGEANGKVSKIHLSIKEVANEGSSSPRHMKNDATSTQTKIDDLNNIVGVLPQKSIRNEDEVKDERLSRQ